MPLSHRAELTLTITGLVIAVASAIASAIFSIMANHTSNQALELAQKQDAESNTLLLDVRVDNSLKLDLANSDQPTLHVSISLLNYGTRELHGCATFYEPVKDDLTPTVYLSSQVEYSGEVWTLAGGQNHRSEFDMPFKREYFGSGTILEIWFRCAYPDIESASTFLRVDLANDEVTKAHDLVRPQRLSSIERANSVYAEKGEPLMSSPVQVPATR